MLLVVNVLAYNEEATVGQVIQAVPRHIANVDRIVVQLVDDGSTDRTAERARAAGAEVLSHPRNLGVGAAFQTGVRSALRQGADVMVNIDGDGQFDASLIARLVEPVLQGRADLATCSRFADPRLVPKMPRLKRLGNRLFARGISLLIGGRYHDVSCGFRAFSREALLTLSLRERFTYTHETFVDLGVRGMRIVEIPMAVRGVRLYGQSRVARRVAAYGLRALKIILRAYRDYRPLQFFGLPSVPLYFAGLCLMAYCLITFFMTGVWMKWAGFTGAFLFVIAMVLTFVAVIADMLDRIRFNQEELLYFERLRAYGAGDEGRRSSEGVLARARMPADGVERHPIEQEPTDWPSSTAAVLEEQVSASGQAAAVAALLIERLGVCRATDDAAHPGLNGLTTERSAGPGAPDDASCVAVSRDLALEPDVVVRDVVSAES